MDHRQVPQRSPAVGPDMECVPLTSWAFHSNAAAVCLSWHFSAQILQVPYSLLVPPVRHGLPSGSCLHGFTNKIQCTMLCSSPTSASKIVPEGFGVSWGPLVSCFVISIVTTFDALYLHPKQMCMRGPVMKLWDGTFRFAFLYRVPVLGPFLQSKGGVHLDILKAHRMRLPEPHQRSMFQVSRESSISEDAAYSNLRAKIVQKFTEEEHSLFETPDGRFFTKGAKGILMEITLDVRTPNCLFLPADSSMSSHLHSCLPSRSSAL